MLRVYKGEARPMVKLQSLLAAVAIATAALFLAVGALMKWHSDGGTNLGVEVLWWAVWVAYTVAKLILLAVLVATLYQWVIGRRGSPARS
jgi:hypothetical protein